MRIVTLSRGPIRSRGSRSGWRSSERDPNISTLTKEGYKIFDMRFLACLKYSFFLDEYYPLRAGMISFHLFPKGRSSANSSNQHLLLEGNPSGLDRLWMLGGMGVFHSERHAFAGAEFISLRSIVYRAHLTPPDPRLPNHHADCCVLLPRHRHAQGGSGT